MIKLGLRNYRALSPNSSAEICLDSSFIALLGKNNAGKSTWIRAIFELRELFNNVNRWCSPQNGETAFNVSSEDDPTVLLNFHNDLPAFISLEVPDDPADGSSRLVKSVLRISRTGHVQFELIRILTPDGARDFRGPFGQIGSIQHANLRHPAYELTRGDDRIEYSAAAMHRALVVLARCVYYGPYRNAINVGAASYFDLQIGTAFIQQWDGWKAGTSIANKRAISRVESDVARLIGAASVEINASADNKSLDVKIDKHPFKLSDLGAGVSELVLTLANALIRRPSFILIDEPESHLHPSLQVEFLTTLAGYSELGIVFATHSIGLARSVADEIFVVEREGTGALLKPYASHPRLAEALGNLSYSGYFPFSHARVLLVEGSTEVRVMQVFLRKLNKEHQYVVLPLGGSQLIKAGADVELGEVVRIAGAAENVFALIDSERDGAQSPLAPDRAAFVEVCERLGIKVHATDRRATDNYWSAGALERAFGSGFEPLLEFARLRDSRNGWPKGRGWQIAENEPNAFFQSHDLGRFLFSLP